MAGLIAAVAAVLVAGSLPLGAHVERDPFFPDPAADTSIFPAAGGDFVAARKLSDPADRLPAFEAYVRRAYEKGVGTRQERRLKLDFSRLSEAQQAKAAEYVDVKAQAFDGPTAADLGLTSPKMTAEETIVVCRPDSMDRLRTSLEQQTLSKSARRDRTMKSRLLELNQRLNEQCEFGEIQSAVLAADNGDTIVIQPGFYTEPTARAVPHQSPQCADMYAQGERSSPSPTYEYHLTCPNDMSLVTVAGRSMDGACIRCNLHIVGSGARPEDVLLEGAKDAQDPGVTGDLFEEGKKHVETAKEVGFRFERTDGAYLGNLTVRNVQEHGVYSIEADGMTFDKIKSYFGQDYGHLSFVTDHLTVSDGDFAGAGDAGIYPGASPPSAPRLNSRIVGNRSHHNGIGLSGTMGSSLLIEDNEFDNNSTGITLDSLGRVGHPGFPQRGTVIRDNRIHSNNFDTYGPDAWVESTTQAPIGVGVVFGGGNDNLVTENHFYDNWRYATMLITVPDVLTGEQTEPDEGDTKLTTSHRNRYYDNVMGVTPEGQAAPNGTDFWWDEMGEANCWDRNRAAEGASIKSDPSTLPTCTTFPNIGTGNPAKTALLLDCNFVERGDSEATGCDWYRVPAKPGAARRR